MTNGWRVGSPSRGRGARATFASGDGSFRGFAGGWFVVGGVDDYAAAHAFAVAFGAEVGLVAQGQVNDAALA